MAFTQKRREKFLYYSLRWLGVEVKHFFFSFKKSMFIVEIRSLFVS